MKQFASSRKPSGPIIRAADLVAWLESDALVANAKAEVRKLRSQAMAARDAERLRALEQSQNEAKKEAAKLAAETVAKAVRYLTSLEREIAELVQESAETILGSLGNEEVALLAVGQALAKARREIGFTVHVAPSQVQDLRVRIERELGPDVLESFVSLQGDPQLRPDTCVLASRLGFINAGIDAQIDALQTGLEAIREKD